VKANLNIALAELKTEKKRTELMSIRSNSSEMTCNVLKERLRATGHRHSIVRLIEFVITILIAYAIDSARSGNWQSFAVFVVLSVILGVAIILVDRRGVQPNGG
jgi:Na+/melibiose symporter-like transporter